MSVTVTAKCVACGTTKKIGPGEVPAGEVPMCPDCFSPMVATKAESEPSLKQGRSE